MANGLGWISFNRTTIEEVCTLEFLPATKTMNENSTDDVVLQETSAGANCNCGNISLAINNPVVKSISPILVDFSSPLGKQVQNIIVITDAVGATATYNDVVSASSTSCGTANLGLLVQNVPDCAISCPESIEVTPGGDTENIEISSTGTECGGLAVSTCKDEGPVDDNITISGPTDGNCNASATSAATFRESTTATVSTNFGSCTTKVFVKRLGWIETNP